MRHNLFGKNKMDSRYLFESMQSDVIEVSKDKLRYQRPKDLPRYELDKLQPYHIQKDQIQQNSQDAEEARRYPQFAKGVTPEMYAEMRKHIMSDAKSRHAERMDKLTKQTLQDYIDESMKLEAFSDEDIPEENKHGDCFVVALNKFMEKPYQYTLVHGVVTGQGAIEGLQYCHAWVEDGNTVIDMTLPARMRKFPKEVYYAIGKIDITRKYSGKEVLDMVEKYMTYGPWDKVFERYY